MIGHSLMAADMLAVRRTVAPDAPSTERSSEPFAAENAVIDLAEAAMTVVIELGYAAQLKARIARMPELAPPPPASPPAERFASVDAGGIDARLLIASVRSVLAEHAKRARTEPSRLQHLALADGLAALLKTTTEAK